MDPKLKGVKKEILDREYILKLNIRTPFSESVHIRIVTKGRKDIFPFLPQNCSLTNKTGGAQPAMKGNSRHSIIKGMVGQRERKAAGEQIAFEMGLKAVIWANPITAKVMTLQLPS